MIQYLDNHVLYYHSVIICSGLQKNMIRNLSAQVFAYMNNLNELYVIFFKDRLLAVDFDFFYFDFFYIIRASESTFDWLKRRFFRLTLSNQ